MKRLITYIKNVIEEMKHVQWPSREQTLKMTTIVIEFSLAFALFLGIFDIGFGNLIKYLIKIKI